ncbi:TruB family pseudouridylate synthase containing protein [Colletotrichum sojae]|uniref:tRNA pseudouridine(55) synthase n=1 Tax=Colletotrichum sojae TaxID=2175907 RepID=A0A8H6JQG2_9PEZI|nr:TruB family pseudouridylate synthase containing protein [Colletotrichum sojae]
MRFTSSLWKMAKDSVIEGVFAINKPYGMSSAQVIRDAQSQMNPSAMFKPLIERDLAAKMAEPKQEWKRRRAAKRDTRVKMGHGGTLDPLATGVLILGVGSGTKSLGAFLDCTKTYETVVLFGASTDTYDRVGRILSRRPYDHITKEQVERAMDGFRGKFEQIPPLYSALKMEGKPLYEYAREGKAIPREIAGREVEVTELELVEWYEPGTHNHRWPTEEAETAEKNLAEQVWRVEKQQDTNRKLSPAEEKEEEKALSEHESLKQKFEERQDNLIRDKPAKKQRPPKKDALMSGALGQLPEGKGSNLIPPPPAADEPFPWTDKGPPAARIRMTVTSGFYVRSFCHDLGAKVGSAGMMAELERSRQSDFEVRTENCLEYSDLEKGESVWGPKVEKMLSAWAEKYPNGAPPSEKQRNNNNNQAQQKNNGRNNHQQKKRKWEDNRQQDRTPKKRRNSSSDDGEKPAKAAKIEQEKAKSPAKEDKVKSPSPAKEEKAKSPAKEEKAKAPTKPDEAEWEGIKD